MAQLQIKQEDKNYLSLDCLFQGDLCRWFSEFRPGEDERNRNQLAVSGIRFPRRWIQKDKDRSLKV